MSEIAAAWLDELLALTDAQREQLAAMFNATHIQGTAIVRFDGGGFTLLTPAEMNLPPRDEEPL